MKITLSDIADKTGFSISTVSRTLRGKGKISKKNERIILEAAKRLNYPLQHNAGTQLKREDLFIALVVGFHLGEFYTSFFDGFIKSAKEKNLDISLFSAPDEINDTCSLLNNLQDKGYSSAILFIPALHSEGYNKILEQVPSDFPLISCSNIIHPVMDTVTFDAYRGGSLVAEHFEEQGYTKVGFIEGPSEKPEARARRNGFVDTNMHSRRLEVTWSYPGDYSLESGQKAFTKFHQLSYNEKPEAIFAANDASAIGFMESARRHGYQFPDDVALAGYDNLPMCEYHYPGITSVNTDHQKLAKITINTLMEQLYDPKPHQGLVSMVPVNLVIRDSSLKNVKDNLSYIAN